MRKKRCLGDLDDSVAADTHPTSLIPSEVCQMVMKDLGEVVVNKPLGIKFISYKYAFFYHFTEFNRYTAYNDWILDDQSDRRYRRHRESMRRGDTSVNHSQYSLRRHKAKESKDDDEEDQEENHEEEENVRPRRSSRVKTERDDSAAEATNSQKEEAEEKEEEDEENKEDEDKEEKDEAAGDEVN